MYHVSLLFLLRNDVFCDTAEIPLGKACCKPDDETSDLSSKPCPLYLHHSYVEFFNVYWWTDTPVHLIDKKNAAYLSKGMANSVLYK